MVVLTSLALFFAFPGRTYYTTPCALIPMLHANSIMVMLNARFRIVGGRETYESSMDMISTPSFLDNAGRGADVSGTYHNSGCSPAAIRREVFSDANFHEYIRLKGMSVSLLSGSCWLNSIDNLTGPECWLPCWGYCPILTVSFLAYIYIHHISTLNGLGGIRC